ncbi:type IV pilin protein [Porticoccus sp. W117]|nr:type IV pilin protein [Porticoccus sp. W117]
MSTIHNLPRPSGFTLIEIIIAVAIVAILTAIALPAYQDQVRRTKRADGKGFLLEIAAAQERFFTQNVSYAANMAALGYANGNSPEGYYTITFPVRTDTTFTLRATPTFTDTECGNLELDHTNMRGSSAGNADDCWD